MAIDGPMRAEGRAQKVDVAINKNVARHQVRTTVATEQGPDLRRE